jgi:nucleoside-diphosphate-sugar epimerase
MKGIESVCHLAAINGTRYFYERPADVLEVGVRGMLNVLDGCAAEGVGELLLASSSEVYQTPPTVPTDETAPLSIPDLHNPRYSYAGSKLISELMAVHLGRNRVDRVLVFRPHNVYGPDMGWEHVIPQLAVRMHRLLSAQGKVGKLSFPIHGTGDQSRAFVYKEDCVAALMLILAKGEHLNVYNIGTTEEVTIRDLAHRVANLLGVEIEIVQEPAPQGEPLRRCPDIGKLQRLGYIPRFRLDDGLRPTVEWYVAHQPVSSAT